MEQVGADVLQVVENLEDAVGPGLAEPRSPGRELHGKGHLGIHPPGDVPEKGLARVVDPLLGEFPRVANSPIEPAASCACFTRRQRVARPKTYPEVACKRGDPCPGPLEGHETAAPLGEKHGGLARRAPLGGQLRSRPWSLTIQCVSRAM